MQSKYSYKIIWISVVLSFTAGVLQAGNDSNNFNQTRSISISVDPRVELVSIIFKLAGNPEYNRSLFFSYISDIDEHFGKFREHPAVELAKELRNTRGVSYDAPMSLAIHIRDINDFEMLVPLEPFPEQLDGRWETFRVREFLEKARQFSKETKFNDFFNSHKPMYERAVSRLRSLIEKEAHLEWFDDFFGARPGAEFHIFLGMTNGPSSYGPRFKLEEKEKYYCILGVWKFAYFGLGEPRFDRTLMPTVIHEFCHSYANPIVDAHLVQLEEPGRRIFSKVQEQMKNNAYGQWQTVMRESLVRACVVRYLVKNEGLDEANRQIESDISRGFFWIRELSDLLIEYEQQRQTYKTLDEFFPNVIEFFKNYDIE